jgi:hypothetical protein
MTSPQEAPLAVANSPPARKDSAEAVAEASSSGPAEAVAEASSSGQTGYEQRLRFRPTNYRSSKPYSYRRQDTGESAHRSGSRQRSRSRYPAHRTVSRSAARPAVVLQAKAQAQGSTAWRPSFAAQP